MDKPKWSNAPQDWLARLAMLGVLAFLIYAVCRPIFLIVEESLSGKWTAHPGKFAGILAGAWIVGAIFGVLVVVAIVVYTVRSDRRQPDPKNRMNWRDVRSVVQWAAIVLFFGACSGIGCAAMADGIAEGKGLGEYHPEDYYRGRR